MLRTACYYIHQPLVLCYVPHHYHAPSRSTSLYGGCIHTEGGGWQTTSSTKTYVLCLCTTMCTEKDWTNTTTASSACRMLCCRSSMLHTRSCHAEGDSGQQPTTLLTRPIAGLCISRHRGCRLCAYEHVLTTLWTGDHQALHVEQEHCMRMWQHQSSCTPDGMLHYQDVLQSILMSTWDGCRASIHACEHLLHVLLLVHGCNGACGPVDHNHYILRMSRNVDHDRTPCIVGDTTRHEEHPCSLPVLLYYMHKSMTEHNHYLG
jgi:hypothetical protein